MYESFVTNQDLAEAVAPLASTQGHAAVRTELRQDIAAVRLEFKQELEATTDKLIEAIRDARTEMLRPFHNWARPVELRLNRVDEVASRLAWIDERLAALERGKFPSAN